MTIFLEMHTYTEYIFTLHPLVYYHDYLLNLIYHLTSSNWRIYKLCEILNKNVHLETKKWDKDGRMTKLFGKMDNNKYSINYVNVTEILCQFIHTFTWKLISLQQSLLQTLYFQFFPTHPPTCNMLHISLNLFFNKAYLDLQTIFVYFTFQ